MKGVFLLVFFVACTSNAPITVSQQPPLIERAAPVAPPSTTHRQGATTPPTLAPVQTPPQAAAGVISEITLERKGCRERCPVYSVDLRKDDLAFYRGVRYTARTGSYKGNIAFARLAQWIAGEDVFSLDDGYGINWIDTERIVLTVASADRTKKIEVGNPAVMPPKLYGIVLGIDGLSDRIRWHKAK